MNNIKILQHRLIFGYGYKSYTHPNILICNKDFQIQVMIVIFITVLLMYTNLCNRVIIHIYFILKLLVMCN